jgi:hypothetical protein
MWAIIAVILFALALVFHLAGGSVAQYVLDFELGGLIALALHMVWGVAVPWRRPPG